MTNQSQPQNRFLPRLIPIVAALILALLLSPLLADRLGFPLPPWFPFAQNSVADESAIDETEEPIAARAEPEAWPTPPTDLLAASGNVTPLSERATPALVITRTPFPTPTSIILPTPAWREINYLTSVKFSASTIVEAERERNLSMLGDITTDRLLLKAVGEVLVGIDLSRISDVEIDGSSIRLRMPAPEVMAVELLPKQSQIYAKSSTFLLSQYEGLETDALAQARRQLRIEIAQNQGLMDLTQKTSRLQLTEFLESVGYQNITFIEPEDRQIE